MSTVTIDKHGMVECDCGVAGFLVAFDQRPHVSVAGLNTAVPDGTVRWLECVSCSSRYSLQDLKNAQATAAAKPRKKAAR